MDIALAKKFIYSPYAGDILVSKNLDTIIEHIQSRYMIPTSVFAVIDTDSGEQLMHIDEFYGGGFFIWDRFMHADSFWKFKSTRKVIDLDEKKEE